MDDHAMSECNGCLESVKELGKMYEELCKLRSHEAKLLGLVGKLKDALESIPAAADCPCENKINNIVYKTLDYMSAEMGLDAGAEPKSRG